MQSSGASVTRASAIANYNQEDVIGGGQGDEDLMRQVLFKRLRIQGYVVIDFASQEEEFLRDATEWFRQGKLKYRVHVVEGLRLAPQALIGLLKGENFGKLLVKVAEPD